MISLHINVLWRVARPSSDQPRVERVVLPTLPNLALIGFSPKASSSRNKWSAAVLADQQGLSLNECIGQALQWFDDRTSGPTK
jgi:hypothetical protein